MTHKKTGAEKFHPCYMPDKSGFYSTSARAIASL